jgi:hypothetical protein
MDGYERYICVFEGRVSGLCKDAWYLSGCGRDLGSTGYDIWQVHLGDIS